jgi:lambda family phage portal protein
MNTHGPITITCPVYGAPTQDRPSSPSPPSRRSSYDLAKTTRENSKHWRDADGLASPSQLTPRVRKVMRDRARHEFINNPYLRRAVRVLVNDTVGRGPRLQLTTPDATLNRDVAELWKLWAKPAKWPQNCRVLCGLRWLTGEGFALPFDSLKLDRLGLPVTVGLRLYEPDQVAHPYGQPWDQSEGDDGVEVDANGEALTYLFLKRHPGDMRAAGNGVQQAQRVKAADVIHWYDAERPGQLRGACPLASALPIFAQLRRYGMATLTAAEVAAMLAGVLETDLPPGEPYQGVSAEDAFDTIELVRGTLLTLPSGYKASQFKPEQPTTGYDAFMKAKLREAGAALDMPYGKIAGDHSDYNYSSGKLDDAPYWSGRETERDDMEGAVFDPFLFRWLDLAALEIPRLNDYRGRWWKLRHVWQYDARPTADPVKDATGDTLNLSNGTDTLADIAAREGTTEDELLDKRAETLRKFRERDLTPPAWLTGGKAQTAQVGDGQPQNPEDARA